MSESILTSTKKVLGLAEDYTAFDPDIITFINSAFSTLNQLGHGPVNGFSITGKETNWSDFSDNEIWLGHIRTYVYLKVRLLFDPPTTSFFLDAVKAQITEHEWRLNSFKEIA